MVPGLGAYFAISYSVDQCWKFLFVEKLLVFGRDD